MDLDHCTPLKVPLDAVKKIKVDIEKMAVERAKLEGLDKNPRLKDPNDRFFNNL